MFWESLVGYLHTFCTGFNSQSLSGFVPPRKVLEKSNRFKNQLQGLGKSWKTKLEEWSGNASIWKKEYYQELKLCIAYLACRTKEKIMKFLDKVIVKNNQGSKCLQFIVWTPLCPYTIVHWFVDVWIYRTYVLGFY